MTGDDRIFEEAFHKGIQAADDVKRSHRDVDEMFHEMAREVREASGGRIELLCQPLRAGEHAWQHGVKTPDGVMYRVFDHVRHRFRVFPVEIAFGAGGAEDEKLQANNLNDLRRVLCTVLAHPEVGRAFRGVLGEQRKLNKENG